jgi:hypothetical protein
VAEQCFNDLVINEIERSVPLNYRASLPRLLRGLDRGFEGLAHVADDLHWLGQDRLDIAAVVSHGWLTRVLQGAVLDSDEHYRPNDQEQRNLGDDRHLSDGDLWYAESSQGFISFRIYLAYSYDNEHVGKEQSQKDQRVDQDFAVWNLGREGMVRMHSAERIQ